MAQFDYYPRREGSGFWVDCQTGFMSHYETRFVIPLLRLPEAPIPAARLNPLYEIDGETHSLVTQFAGTIPARDLRYAAGSLADDSFRIGNAIDFLLGGF
ncbi:MAG: CcdB family protein [Sphingomonadales bacterium]|nr:CcdB family protein [Sphingomonadales bacterium]